MASSASGLRGRPTLGVSAVARLTDDPGLLTKRLYFVSKRSTAHEHSQSRSRDGWARPPGTAIARTGKRRALRADELPDEGGDLGRLLENEEMGGVVHVDEA